MSKTSRHPLSSILLARVGGLNSYHQRGVRAPKSKGLWAFIWPYIDTFYLGCMMSHERGKFSSEYVGEDEDRIWPSRMAKKVDSRIYEGYDSKTFERIPKFKRKCDTRHDEMKLDGFRVWKHTGLIWTKLHVPVYFGTYESSECGRMVQTDVVELNNYLSSCCWTNRFNWRRNEGNKNRWGDPDSTGNGAFERCSRDGFEVFIERVTTFKGVER